MRTIKFRGKNIETGEWVYGFYTQGGYVKEDGTVKVRHIIHSDFLYDVEENTIGQHTGLMDKNGNEIYEGDIYRYDNPDSINEVSYCAGGGFVGFDLAPAKHNENMLLDVEVIGNIHDNPELLKGE